jgi:hypothetical protein
MKKINAFDNYYRVVYFITPIGDQEAALKILSDISNTDICDSPAISFIENNNYFFSKISKNNELSLTFVESTSNVITIIWRYDADSNRNKSSDEIVVSIRMSNEKLMNRWAEVYRGSGSGCIVNNLHPNMTYHIRVKVLHKLNMRGNSSLYFVCTTKANINTTSACQNNGIEV